MIATEKRTIVVRKEKASEIQSILDTRNGHYPECDPDGVIETFTALFRNGLYAVDVKVCNGNTPYIDPVLFVLWEDKASGRREYHEVVAGEPGERLLGEYRFHVDGYRLVTEIVAGN